MAADSNSIFGKIGSPDSGSTEGRTSNTARTEAMLNHTKSSAKYRPGQLLHQEQWWDFLSKLCYKDKTNRLPNPKTNLLGSYGRSLLTLLLSSFRYRAGMNWSGSGKIRSSRIICLFFIDQPRGHKVYKHRKVADHRFVIIIDPAGIFRPSYSSSCTDRCGIPLWVSF